VLPLADLAVEGRKIERAGANVIELLEVGAVGPGGAPHLALLGLVEDDLGPTTQIPGSSDSA
jgi:hypothetical protein